MRLTRCELTNFMGFASLDLKVEKDMLILVANNGMGKSSVLKAMRVALGGWMLGVPAATSVPIERWMMRYELHQEGYELDTVRALKTEVRATAELADGSTVEWARSRTSGPRSRTNRKEANSIRDVAQERATSATPLPLLAYYGARRRVTYPVASVESGPDERQRGYDGALDSSIDYQERFGRWKRLRYQALFEPAAEIVHDALVRALVLLLPGVSHVEFHQDFLQPVVTFEDDTAGGGLRAFSALSDGFQNILSLGLDIALRAIQLNPKLGAEVLKETRGVVLIDEADQHLHPAWQAGVTSGLRAAFPNMQFVLTTHSPLMAMGAAPHAQIVRLRAGPDGRPVAETLPGTVFGATVEDALRSEAFEVASTWAPAMTALMNTRAGLLSDLREHPENAALTQRLRENTGQAEAYRSGPISNTEDVIRRVLNDLTAGEKSLTDKDLERLRQQVEERVLSLGKA